MAANWIEPADVTPQARADIMVIEGAIIEGGVECPLFRTTDGQEYTLFGMRPHLETVGTRLRLRGHLMQYSTCMQGISFQTIERLE